MPPTGSIFTDWQQVEKQSRLLIDEDFSWSEPPQRRRRRITGEPVRVRRAAVLEYEPEPVSQHELNAYEPLDDRAVDAEFAQVAAAEATPWDQSTAVHSQFDEMMEQWNADSRDVADRAFDLSDPGTQVAGVGARRTVVITGRGDDRYVPAPRRSRSAQLRFHERSGFSPDRAGLWAVLLGIALVIGCIAH
jgi:hypothetical protein